MDKKTKKILKLLFRVIGIILFVAILSRIDLRSILLQYKTANPATLTLAVASIIMLIVIKSLRWKSIAAMQGIAIPLRSSFTAYAASLYVGIITPGRIGDFAKSLYLINSGIPAGKALFSSLVDRLFDIAFLIAAGYISLFFIPDIIHNQIMISTLLVLSVSTISLLLFKRRDLIIRFTRRFITGLKPFKGGEVIGNVVEEMLEDFSLINIKRAFGIGVLTAIAWTFHYSFYILSAYSLGIKAPLGILIMSISAAIFIGLLPVSIAGVGTRDLALILIFSRIGLTREQAISFSLTFILLYLLTGAIGFICWLSTPLKGINLNKK